MKPHLTQLAKLFAITILLHGCIKDDDFRTDKMSKGEWSPEFAVPLINSELGLNDIVSLDSGGLFAVNNHQLSLIYKTNIYTQYGYQFFAPVSQSNLLTLQMTPPDTSTLYQTGTVSRSINVVMPLTFPNGEQVDSMTFRRGAISIGLMNDIPHPGTLHITIPSAVIGGQPFSKDVPFSAGSNVAFMTQQSFDMTGYSMSMNNGGPNRLGIDYTLTFDNSGSTANAMGHNFDITFAFDSITPATVFGYFGQREFMPPLDTTELSIFNNFEQGSMFFDAPSLTISLENSFGMPINAQINSLQAILPNGSVMALTGPTPSPLIDYPFSMGQVVRNSFTWDNSNSNIQAVFNSTPKQILYDLSAGTNAPLPTYNFMSDSSIFKADLKIEFPMKGYASGFTVQDTVDFGLGDIDMIEAATFRLNVTNGFPVSANMQLYFADENLNIIDSMFSVASDKLIVSANVDNNGRATTPAIRLVDEEFSGNRLEHLFATKKIFIKAAIETKDAPNTSVAIYDDYKIKFKIGVRTKLKLEY
jgi:hypothetical protein